MGHPFKMNHTVAEMIWKYKYFFPLSYFSIILSHYVHIHYIRVIFQGGVLGHFQGGGGCVFSSVRVKIQHLSLFRDF